VTGDHAHETLALRRADHVDVVLLGERVAEDLVAGLEVVALVRDQSADLFHQSRQQRLQEREHKSLGRLVSDLLAQALGRQESRHREENACASEGGGGLREFQRLVRRFVALAVAKTGGVSRRGSGGASTVLGKSANEGCHLLSYFLIGILREGSTEECQIREGCQLCECWEVGSLGFLATS
jgi:hypothetical protein